MLRSESLGDLHSSPSESDVSWRPRALGPTTHEPAPRSNSKINAHLKEERKENNPGPASPQHWWVPAEQEWPSLLFPEAGSQD